MRRFGGRLVWKILRQCKRQNIFFRYLILPVFAIIVSSFRFHMRRDLSFNDIESVPENLFDDLPNLEEMYVLYKQDVAGTNVLK